MTPEGTGRKIVSLNRITSTVLVALIGVMSAAAQNVDEDGNNILDDAANEPSLALDPRDANVMVIGWRQFDNVSNSFRESGVAHSHDAGLSRTFPRSLWPGRFGSDPVVAADSAGRFYYLGIGIDRPGTRMFRSFDAGLNWDGPPGGRFRSYFCLRIVRHFRLGGVT